MKDILTVLQRLREVVVHLAKIKWDTDDCRRERLSHDNEWRVTGLSKNILDGLIIRMIKLELLGRLDAQDSSRLITDIIADFAAVKVGEGMPISGRFHLRRAAIDDPYLMYGFVEALNKRLDRFESFANVPFPGKALKSDDA